MSIESKKLGIPGMALIVGTAVIAALAGWRVGGPLVDAFRGGDNQAEAAPNIAATAPLNELDAFRRGVLQDRAAKVALGTCLATPEGINVWRITVNPGVIERDNPSFNTFVVSDPSKKRLDNPTDSYKMSVDFIDTKSPVGDVSVPVLLASRVPVVKGGDELTPSDYVELVPMTSRVYVSGPGLDSTFRRIINGKDTPTVPLIRTADHVLGQFPSEGQIVAVCKQMGGLTS